MIINSNDLYTYTVSVPLHDNKGGAFGATIISYEIRRYRDVRNLHNKLAYQVLCTQRIIIPNKNPYPIGAQNIERFDDYPAVFTNNIAISNVGGDAPTLVKYTPKTINASINTALNNGTVGTTSTSRQHTTGSSTSQSNSYEVSTSLGFFGEALTGGVSSSYSQSWGSDQSQSNTTGSDSGVSNQSSYSESMSVKDWACYSSVHVANDSLLGDKNSITWIWGQEYPWDVVQFNNKNNAQTNTTDPTNSIALPDFVIPLMMTNSSTDGGTTNNPQLLPPSQLSLFGLDFTMKSVWIVNPSKTSSVTITHIIDYCTATHYNQGGISGPIEVAATLNPAQTFTYTSDFIDLYAYGLDPISSTATNAGAIIGFIPNKFIIPPAPVSSSAQATQFKAISSSNNLMISDTTVYPIPLGTDPGLGFTASETALTANFTQSNQSLQITMSFKIIDTINSYTLFMKHWKQGTTDGTNPTGIMLTILFNEDITAQKPLNKITKYVDALEAEGGESNLLSIILRNKDYGSVDYYDFLQLGLNTVQITITPNPGEQFTTCGYQIRAISVESS